MSHLPSPLLKRKLCGCKYGLKELKLLETDEPRVISPVRNSLLSPKGYTHLDRELPSWFKTDLNLRKSLTSPRKLYLD